MAQKQLPSRKNKLGAKQDRSVPAPGSAPKHCKSGVTPAKANATHGTLKGRKQAKIPKSFRSQLLQWQPCNPAPAPGHSGARAARDSVHSKHRHFLGFGDRMKI